MKTLFFPSFERIIFIYLFMLINSNYLFSQNSIILKYPGLKITPEDFIPSPAHAVGMQYTYEDPVRDLFITPGKNLPDFRATGFLSYQFYADDYNYNVTAYPPYFENFESKFHKSHFPAGGILNLYGLSFGFLYGFGSVPIESFRNYNNGYGSYGDTLRSEGKNKFFNLSLAVNPFSTFTLGISYSGHNFNRVYNYLMEDHNVKYFIPQELIIGAGYTFLGKFRAYLAYGNYKIRDEEKTKQTVPPNKVKTNTTEYSGDLISFDFKYEYNENLILFFRAAYDTRKINWKEEIVQPSGVSGPNRYQDGNARYYKLGVGANYKADKINFYGEFNYEPGYYNLQYVTTTVTWYPPVSGNEINHYNWDFGLGVEFQPFDFMKLELGDRYYKSQRKLTQEIDLTNYATYDPDFTTGTNVITAGTEIRLYNFVFNYVFNYSTYHKYFSPALTPFPFMSFREFNTLQHKFLLRYEF